MIILIISAIAKGNTDFEACLRVSASVMVVMPVLALLSFLMGINLTLGLIINMIIYLYSLWLIYQAVTASLKANEGTSKIVLGVLAALMVLFTLTSLTATRSASKFLKEYNKDAQELLKDLK